MHGLKGYAMTKTGNIGKLLTNLLVAVVAILVALSPASNGMTMPCSLEHFSIIHTDIATTGHSQTGHLHGSTDRLHGCCNSTCSACVAILAPEATVTPVQIQDPASPVLAIRLVGLALPPLHGPPRNDTSML